MADPLSYLLCGTPRTGSTLLCGLLTSTGVGQAVSWARAEQTGYWQDGDVPSAQPRFELGQGR